MNPRAHYYNTGCGIQDLIMAGKLDAFQAQHFYNNQQRNKLSMLAPLILADKVDVFQAANFYDMQQAQKLAMLTPLILADKVDLFTAANFYDMQQVQNIQRNTHLIMNGNMSVMQASSANFSSFPGGHCHSSFGGTIFGSFQQPGCHGNSNGYSSSQQQFHGGYSSRPQRGFR